MSDLTLSEEDGFSTSDETAAKDNSTNNSKDMMENTPPKKAAKSKVSKATAETSKIAKPAATKTADKGIKKAAAKKVTEQQVESLEPQAAKPKKAAGKKTALVTEQPKKVKAANTVKQTGATTLPKATKSVKKTAQIQSTEKESSEVEAQTPVGVSNTVDVSSAGGESTSDLSDREQISPITSNAEPSPLRKITFQIKFHTVFGESLSVVGNHALLGNNDVEKAFPLTYLNGNYWSGTIDIPEEQRLTESLVYHYVFKNIDGKISEEWGTDKVVDFEVQKNEELLLIDTWNPSSAIENTFYTEPFQEVLLKDSYTKIETTIPGKVTHVFRAKVPLLQKGQALCVIGSASEMGEWNTEKPLLLSRKHGEVWHSISLDLSGAVFPLNYKYGLFDINTNAFIAYESGSNRMIENATLDKLTIVSDGFAAFNNDTFKGAGVAIPVFSLRTANSFGVGEFPDLKLMVDWAKHVGLKLVQLLPVNDTTATHSYTDSYPYAAISAFALHPLYLHLPSIVNKENQALLTSLKDRQDELNSKSEVDYVEVMRVKWDLLKQIFPSQKERIFKSADFNAFFQENKHWLVPYAAFSYFREQNKTADFNQWQTNQKYDAAQIQELAGSPLQADNQISIYYYIQYHLHLQLHDATEYAHQNGIIVKGDIPIGIYRNSCDAWEQPELFCMDMQAGAPPDDFAVKGQNWGFPTYNWQRMRENGFTWWKKRFTQMSYYFDAFRIDHILGFFRIWSIPMKSVEGIMGHFVPALPVHINEIAARGIAFDFDRFCKPFINDTVLQQFFGLSYKSVIEQFIFSSSDNSYSLKPEFDTQRKVENYFAGQDNTEQNRALKEGLFKVISNVILFEAEGGQQQQFHFRFAMYDTLSYQHLDDNARRNLYELYVDYFFRRQDQFWMKEAMMKLPELKRSNNMLICGEDLGMVPACVPGVMKELAILSLEIQRMPKDLTHEFFHPNDAPYLSVVTPSTHDMSTIRGWWEEDRAATQRFFNNQLGQWGTAPYFCEAWINRIILLQHLYSPAMWSIFQLQDLLGMSTTLRRENPHDERINIPADSKHYWRYRMHLPIEQLIQEDEFNTELRAHVAKSGR